MYRLGATPNDEDKWDPHCDLNYDAEINLEDWWICNRALGEKGDWEEIPRIILFRDRGIIGNLDAPDIIILVCFPPHFSGWGIRR
ncbi:MAG: hypothetical protein NWE83_14125 [Candidatus Bathyarchaeota archaeon]|nr:hypothetical protein [Candidatus Bathyarchaeota archaeon]